LSTSRLRWNLSNSLGLVYEGTLVLREAQQEIGERESGSIGRGRARRCPVSGEDERAAGDIGWEVVVEPDLKLRSRL